MRLPEGFKQVPGLSICPIEWKVVQANDICSKITKGTTPPKSDIVEDGNIPFLRVNNLTFEGKFNEINELLFVSELAHRRFLARSIAYPNDILMNIVGPPLGKIVLLPDTFAEYNLNQAIIIYRLDTAKVDTIYFLNYLKSNYAQYWLSSRSKKTSGQQNLTIELCKDLPVPLPKLPEQQKIAQILSTWDKAIEKMEALIAAKQKRKKALMQQLLTGKMRFAGFDKEWSHKKVSEICKSFSGGTPSRNKPEYFNGNIAWIKSGEINQRVILQTEEKISESGFKNSSAKIVPKNSILVAMYGATAGKVAITKIEAAINQAILAIIPNDDISTDFLFYLIELEMAQVVSLVQGGQPGEFI